MSSLKYLLVKEYKQMFRNILLPIVFVLLPIAMTNGIPHIATQEVKNLNIAVIDADHSTLSGRLIQKMAASTMFNLYASCDNYDEVLQMIKRGDVDFCITIDNGFERDIYRTGSGEVMLTVNAVNGMKGGLGNNYLMQIVMAYAQELSAEAGLTQKRPVSVDERYLFNQSLDYKPYMIPALISMILILLVGFLPALNVVGEKERGTIEQINVTPVSKMEFILSKMIPYWSVGIFVVVVAMAMAAAVHGVRPQGSIGLILLFNMVFILAISSFGLTISNYSDNMRQAAMVMFFFIVIFILTSGLISPLTSMPEWAQEATRINPMRYIIAAMRDIYLKGSNLQQLLPQLVPLCIFAAVASTWAIISYPKKS